MRNEKTETKWCQNGVAYNTHTQTDRHREWEEKEKKTLMYEEVWDFELFIWQKVPFTVADVLSPAAAAAEYSSLNPID